MSLELYRVGEFTAEIMGRKVTPRPEVTLVWARKWSKIFGVDVPLVMALAEVESTHDPSQVLTRTGAFGLGQQRVKFAPWKLAKIKDQFSRDPQRWPVIRKTMGKWHGRSRDLLDPDLNLMLTTWELSRLLRIHDGNRPAALASYNLGLSAYQEKARQGFDPRKYDYVSKVLGNRGKYAHLS